MIVTRTLNEVFDIDEYGGIFTFLQNLDVPWKDEDIAELLDYEYMYNIAGMRALSPLVKHVAEENDSGILTEEDCTKLATLIYRLYRKRWYGLWSTMDYEYDPIENYSMTEVMSNDNTTHTYGRTDTDTHTKATTETETDSTQGFDSTSYSPSDQYVTAHTGSDTDTHAETGSDSDTHSYTLTRSGNIGVTTSQQMIEQERALWMFNFFHDVVFPDINRILTLSVY